MTCHTESLLPPTTLLPRAYRAHLPAVVSGAQRELTQGWETAEDGPSLRDHSKPFYLENAAAKEVCISSVATEHEGRGQLEPTKIRLYVDDPADITVQEAADFAHLLVDVP